MKHIFAILSLLLASLLAIGGTEADAAPPPLSVYGQLPGLENVVISPSGERIAFIGVIGEERRVVVIDRNSKPILVFSLGDAKVRDLYWAGDDRIIIYKSDTVRLGVDFTADKAELFSAVVVPVENPDKAWLVFQGDHLITGGVRGFYGVHQRGGKWYGYFGGITMDKDGKTDPYLQSTKPVLYEVDFDTRSARKIGARAGRGIFRSWIINPQGGVSATLDLVS